MNDKLLKKLISQDKAGQVDPEIKTRLNHTFMLKSMQYPIHQNSFSGFLNWILSSKSIGVKTALAAMLVGFFFFQQEVSISPGSPVLLDSTRVSQVLEIDSAIFQTNSKTVKDSVFL